VYKVKRISDGFVAALKSLTLRGDITEESIINEVGLMKICDHEPNILSVLGLYKQDKRYFMVVEIMQYPLNDIIELLQGRISENACKYLLNESLKGLHVLHQKDVIHRDIKSDNILINDKGEVKLADFGLSTKLTVQ
jgi:serine/threonine-protein kinase CLA4